MNERRKPYPFDQFEPRWQAIWEERQLFHARNPGETGFDSAKSKFYVLDMFPYPSGAGLHVGHPEGYTATDIVARYKRLRGFSVLHPMGWDAFGLPAEQYAIKSGQHPAVTTRENVAKFKRQLTRIGFSYDWQRDMQSAYSTSQTNSIGQKESNYSSETGPAEVKVRRSISRSIKATRKFAFLRRDPTRFMAVRSSCSRRNARSWISLSPRSNGPWYASIVNELRARVSSNVPICRKKKPACLPARTPLIRRTTKRFQSGSLITCWLVTGPGQSVACPRMTSATWNSPKNSIYRLWSLFSQQEMNRQMDSLARASRSIRQSSTA